MGRGPIIGRLHPRGLGGQFDPGRISAPTVVRPSATVPPVSTAPRANTAPRVSAGPAPRTTAPTVTPVSTGKDRPANKPAPGKPNTDRKGPTGPGKMHTAPTPAGRAK